MLSPCWVNRNGCTDSPFQPCVAFSQSTIFKLKVQISSPWMCHKALRNVCGMDSSIIIEPLSSADYTQWCHNWAVAFCIITLSGVLLSHWLWLIVLSSPPTATPTRACMQYTNTKLPTIHNWLQALSIRPQ